LQQSIAFFQLDDGRGDTRAAQRPAPRSQRGPAPRAVRTARASASAPKARNAGFALDLRHGGPDHEDADFGMPTA
jgi:hypothetical protein